MKVKCYKKDGFWTVDTGNQMWDYLSVTAALRKVSELKGMDFK